MMALLRSWFPKPKQRLEIVRVESQKTSLAQWRKGESSVGASMELARNPVYRAQRDIMEFHHPRHTLMNMGASETDRLVHQARIEGYEMALVVMDSFPVPLTNKSQIEATFEPPEQEQ